MKIFSRYQGKRLYLSFDYINKNIRAHPLTFLPSTQATTFLNSINFLLRALRKTWVLSLWNPILSDFTLWYF